MGNIKPPNEYEARQRDDGSYQCLRCHGDWYACECPRIPEADERDV